MTTYCPSCGMNEPTDERAQGGLRQWVCISCGLVLKEEGVNDQVLGRMAVQKMSTADLAAARAAAEKAAAEKAAAEKAARATAQARAALIRRQSGEAPASIDLDEIPVGEFVVEMAGVEKVVAGAQPALSDPFSDGVLPSGPEPMIAAPPAPAQVESVAPSMVLGSLFERVVVAEDTALVREIVKDALVQNGISQHVRGCANGAEFLQVIAEAIAAGVTVDLAILDVDMPVLNGYYAAIALRAVERGLRARAVPIVFFTAYPCDDTFKKVLEHCQPARYLNKGADSSPPRIAGRLVQVLSSLKR